MSIIEQGVVIMNSNWKQLILLWLSYVAVFCCLIATDFYRNVQLSKLVYILAKYLVKCVLLTTGKTTVARRKKTKNHLCYTDICINIKECVK